MKNQTPYNKIYRETHLLRDVREIYFEKEGWVQGNNLNIIDERIDENAKRFYEGEDEDQEEGNGKSSFKGAINAEPTMNDTVGEEILGIRTNNLFSNAVDMDMGAFYPSCKIASNMDAITLLYKASFDNSEFETGQFPNKSLNQQYEEKDKNGNLRKIDITGEAVNTYASKNLLTFTYNYLNLPSIAEIEKIIKKELEKG